MNGVISYNSWCRDRFNIVIQSLRAFRRPWLAILVFGWLGGWLVERWDGWLGGSVFGWVFFRMAGWAVEWLGGSVFGWLDG